MTYTVTFETRAVEQASRFLDEDPPGLRRLLDTIDALADNPRPANSSAFGSPGLRRLRIGRYRVLYQITENTISVGHIARTAG